MIRNVLVMKSGLVLFSQGFANTVQQVRASVRDKVAGSTRERNVGVLVAEKRDAAGR